MTNKGYEEKSNHNDNQQRVPQSWEGMGKLWWNKPRSCIRIRTI